jgi:squalene-hopene/tetraprenyl-beta-curcumene cyclase
MPRALCNVVTLGAGAVAIGLVAGLLSAGVTASTEPSWNPKAAAEYLDRRASWWIAWPPATREQGTVCISCHTALPYALSRSALDANGSSANERRGSSANERRIMDSVTKRVRLWKELKPYYGEKDGANESLKSRGSESVLNALILASYDARNGKLSDDTRTAFRNMWEMQEATGNARGAWPWIDFENEPFEAKDSVFYGASLAAVAVGTAPENFRANPEIQEKANRMREYLAREYAAQSLINQAVLVWACAKLPGLLPPNQQASIIDAILSKQQADGGWSLGSLSWRWRSSSVKSLVKLWARSDVPLLENKSDGYATALIVFALEQANIPRTNPHLEKGLSWLLHNQNRADGRWPSYSLNHHRDASGTGLFMSDAATAYAVLALTGSGPR